MADQPERTEPIVDFFDREASCACEQGDVTELTPISRTLLGGLVSIGVSDRSVLDLGSGLGRLARALLDQEAARVTGIDLSPESVGIANARARESGLEDRARFEVGDAARARLEPHDIVVLDKVVCCYPDAATLMANAVAAARLAVALALPASTGLGGVASRVAFFFENLWRRIRRDPFRAYVHDVRAIDRTLRAAGFEPSFRTRHPVMWDVVVYERV